MAGIRQIPVPAAFGRLCVETNRLIKSDMRGLPAAFGRLCVETVGLALFDDVEKPAAFGRLCVETLKGVLNGKRKHPSRLRAAVC